MVNQFKEIICSNVKVLLEKKILCSFWFNSRNWGDALNPVLIKHLSGMNPTLITKYTIIPKKNPIYLVIGSILDHPFLEDKKILQESIIWGTGFIQQSGRLRGTPKQICAVRGPLTRENILQSGIKCPKIYGDPALLYPKIYNPNVPKKYKLGIIPHYIDKKNNLLRNFQNIPEITIIDIERPINSVVDHICSCKHIASSSLHGVIAADAYSVPSVWIKFSENVLGEGFKFRDYFGSVGRSETEPNLVICEDTTVDNIYDTFYNYKIDIDLNELLDACPFYYENKNSGKVK